jgi:hypothetical protein
MLTHLHYIPGYKYSTTYGVGSLNCVVAMWRRRDKKTSVRAGELGSGREKVIRWEEGNDSHSVARGCYVLIKSELDAMGKATNARMKNIVIYSCIRG